jgi:hypothetical protein
VSTALHLAAVCLTIAAVAWAFRFVWRQSRPAGLMLAGGLAIRAGGGAFFLAVSYFHWPFLTTLQMGDGFWTLASDAQEYYRLAGLVAGRWQATITPGYVGPLGIWMRVVGVNPASPVLFALVMYVLAVVTLVAAFGRNGTRAARQALHLGVAALSFTPMLVYAAVFGLKDVFFTTLVVILAVAWLTIVVRAIWTRAALTTSLLAAAAGIPAMWLIAGTRAYFAILVWSAIAVTYAGRVAAGPSRRRSLAQAAGVLAVLAIVITFGAEGNYPRFVRALIASAPEALLARRAPIAGGGLAELDRRREAIDNYGGNSMLSRRATGSEGLPGETAGGGRLEGVAVGLGAILLPSPVLGTLAGIGLHVGTMARVIADADTLAFDLTAVMILWLLIANRRHISALPLVFALALTMLVALPLAYVMTNFGTLIRLRLMVAAPIWLLTLALAPRFAARPSSSVPAPSQSRAGRPARSGER